MGWRWDRGTLAAVASLGLTVVAAGVLVLVPFGTRQSMFVGAPGGEQVVGRVEHVTLLQTEGSTVLIPLGLPVAVALIATLAGLSRRAKVVRVGAAGLLVVFAALGALSIGVFFLPSAAAMVAAAAWSFDTTSAHTPG